VRTPEAGASAALDAAVAREVVAREVVGREAVARDAVGAVRVARHVWLVATRQERQS